MNLAESTRRNRIPERLTGVTFSPLTNHSMVLLSQLLCSDTVVGVHPQWLPPRLGGPYSTGSTQVHFRHIAKGSGTYSQLLVEPA